MRRTAVILLTLAALGSPATSTAASDHARTNRLAGPDRFVTARVIATATFDQSSTVTLVSGRDFPDALASAYLNGITQTPLFLTERERLPDGLVDTLRSLDVSGIQVLGGPAAVSDALMAELRGLGFVVDRLAGGDDRYETARKVAELFPPEGIGQFGEGRAAIVASGQSFADALAAGPMSASQRLPILLSTSDRLHVHARVALDGLGIEQALLVGGTAALSADVAAEISAMGIAVRRIAGSTRQATAEAIARVESGELGYPVRRVIVARGDTFADALSVGIRAGLLRAPILLTETPDVLGSHAETFIANSATSIDVIDVVGGDAAVSPAVEASALAAARS